MLAGNVARQAGAVRVRLRVRVLSLLRFVPQSRVNSLQTQHGYVRSAKGKPHIVVTEPIEEEPAENVCIFCGIHDKVVS